VDLIYRWGIDAHELEGDFGMEYSNSQNGGRRDFIMLKSVV
tara:strand:- start:206 stop:328 length:123 start_codon:yes stop_codon:yes gene_type:complete